MKSFDGSNKRNHVQDDRQPNGNLSSAAERPANSNDSVMTPANDAAIPPFGPGNALFDELQTIGPDKLAALIGRSQKSIKADCFRRPHTLPPRFIIPGTRKLLWRMKDVRDWMEVIAAQQVELRRLAADIASKTGSTPGYMERSLRRTRSQRT